MNFMDKKYFKLNKDAGLFEFLSHKPMWWKLLLEDKDLYMNIRKENRINVYYRGASIMSLSYNDGKVTAEIHNYYLGFEKDTCAALGIKYGNQKKTPEEIVCRLPMIKKRVEANKKYIACLEEEGMVGNIYSSEKYVQSQLYMNDNHYFDTEFALRLDDGTDIRIDLVRMSDHGEICFVELKLIDDQRLYPSRGRDAEIITQMENYERFLLEANKLKGKTGKPVLVEYYTTVLEIMEKIGIHRTSIKPVMVHDKVFLFIKQTYTKKSSGREKRLNTIKKVCDGLYSNIDDVLTDYNSL